MSSSSSPCPLSMSRRWWSLIRMWWLTRRIHQLVLVLSFDQPKLPTDYWQGIGYDEMLQQMKLPLCASIFFRDQVEGGKLAPLQLLVVVSMSWLLAGRVDSWAGLVAGWCRQRESRAVTWARVRSLHQAGTVRHYSAIGRLQTFFTVGAVLCSPPTLLLRLLLHHFKVA